MDSYYYPLDGIAICCWDTICTPNKLLIV